MLHKSFTAFDGTEIAYNVTGTGPAMVLCDGIGCNQYAWKYLAPYFSSRYTIYRWNYRGHGKSGIPQDRRFLSMDDIRRDMHQLITTENLSDIVLVGHSMGVQVIMDYALQHGDRIKALVPLNGAYGTPLKTFHGHDVADKVFPYLNAVVQRFPKAIGKVWKTILATPLPYEIAVRGEVNGDFIAREDFMPYFADLGDMDPTVFFGMLGHLNAHDLAGRIHTITKPTLIVAGERDTFTPAWLSFKMQQLIPQSELLLIPGGSHSSPIEFPELINLRVEKFLNERVAQLLAA
jgi:pimeloyl-ACP methyl ester carboxylesterase